MRASADEISTKEAHKRVTQIDLTKAMIDSRSLNSFTISHDDSKKLENKQVQDHEAVSSAAVNQIQEVQSYGQTQDMTEKAAKKRSRSSDNTTIRIKFKIYKEGVWNDSSAHDVDPSDPSCIERVAIEHIKREIRPFDTTLRLLTSNECFEAVVTDGTNTILLIPGRGIDINDELTNSALKIYCACLNIILHLLIPDL